jgi:2-polyprenyl-3-methyl-5-hydroxy-6-metoxy-1,4-benzoquinol methylase
MAYFERIWEAVAPGAEPEAFELRRNYLLAAIQPGARVLDLGCGEGWFTRALQEAGADATGADVAREPLRRAAGDLRLVHIESDELPFAPAAFDAVWAGELLEHVQDVVGLLAEIHRVLRPGGELILSTPDHPLRLRLRLALVPGAFERHLDPRSDHVRFFTARSLGTLLRDAGFGQPAIERVAGHLLARAPAAQL